MKYKSQSGSALVMIIVAIGLVAAVSAYLMNQNQTAMLRGKSLSMVRDANNLSAQVLRMLADGEACKNSLQGLDPSESPVMALKNKTNVEIINASTTFGRTSLKIENMQLKDEPGLDDGVDTAANTTNLIITYKLVPNTSYESRHLQRKVKINFTTDASGIDECHSMSAGKDPLWQLTTGTNDIFYAAGNVGIATDTPSQKLDVKGRIRAQNASGDKITFSDNIQLGTDLRLEIISGGKLADIGSSIAEGKEKIQFSTNPSVCNARTEQSIRYHSGSGTVQGCTSGYWRTVKASYYPKYMNAVNNLGPRDCSGYFEDCSEPCGGGTETYVVERPATAGGAPCKDDDGNVRSHGDIRYCNTQACDGCKLGTAYVEKLDTQDFFLAERAAVGQTCDDIKQARKCISTNNLSGNPLYQYENCFNSCAPETGTWGNCSADAPASIDGATFTLDNAAPGFDGDAVFTCDNGFWGVAGNSCSPL